MNNLLNLSAPMTYPDGSVSFVVNTTDAAPVFVRCSVTDVGNIFAALGNLVSVLPEEPDFRPTEYQPGGHQFPVMPADGLGFLPGTTPDTTALVLRVGPLWVAYQIQSSALGLLGDRLSAILKTLSAGQGLPH